MIEAMICGAIPITCSDNDTAKEFLPPDFICEPNSDSIVKYVKKINAEYDVKKELALKLGKNFKKKFDKTSIAKNILNIKK